MNTVINDIDRAVPELLPHAQFQVLQFAQSLTKNALSNADSAVPAPHQAPTGDYIKELLRSMPDVGEDEDFTMTINNQREQLEWDFFIF